MSSTILEYTLGIDGKTVKSASLDCINPSSGEVIARVGSASKADIQTAISAARQKFDDSSWSGLSVKERGRYLVGIAKLIRHNAKELADLESASTGKTGKQATFIDVPTAAETFEYFGQIDVGAHSRAPLQDRINPVAAPVKSLTAFEPMGVVAAIIPWNYPLIIAAWKVAAALAAGNTVILKPSRLGCVSLMRLAQLIDQTDFPKGVLQIVPTIDQEAAEELVRNPQVDMVSFTGGTETGQNLMKLAAGTAKKISLELGGKSPAIVFADCDFNAALGGVMSSIFMNQGQMCTACSRLLIEDKIYDQFLSALIEKTQKLKIGPANSYETEFGPLVSREHRDDVLKAINDAVKEGAKIVCGGKIPSDSAFKGGAYLEPTILSHVENSMKVAQEEIFGPVLCVMKFSDCPRTRTIANDSKYGLAASIWTKDLKKADQLARQLQTGTVWINTYGGFYNEASFGGYKQSGFGRELGVEGLLSYTRSKHICTDQTPGGMPLVSSWF